MTTIRRPTTPPVERQPGEQHPDARVVHLGGEDHERGEQEHPRDGDRSHDAVDPADRLRAEDAVGLDPAEQLPDAHDHDLHAQQDQVEHDEQRPLQVVLLGTGLHVVPEGPGNDQGLDHHQPDEEHGQCIRGAVRRPMRELHPSTVTRYLSKVNRR